MKISGSFCQIRGMLSVIDGLRNSLAQELRWLRGDYFAGSFVCLPFEVQLGKLVWCGMAEPVGTFDPSLPLYKVAYRSWASMKPGVMAWLWYLNAIYWIAFLYWPRGEAAGALASYLAVSLLIAWMISSQRGLTRLTGLIHLPWVPFVAYLGIRLFSDVLGERLSIEGDALYYIWLQIVFWSTSMCLVLDALDVVRWLAGERYVLGTPAAEEAGASRLARQD